jgi:hypothetical protein
MSTVARWRANGSSATRQLTSEGFEAHNPAVRKLPVTFLRFSQHRFL